MEKIPSAILWVTLYDRSIYICKEKKILFPSPLSLSFTAVFRIWGLFLPSGWLHFLYHFLFPFLSLLHWSAQRKRWLLQLGFWRKILASTEHRLSKEKIKLSPLKVCLRFQETEAIINMQWHMHTSKMVLDASSRIIKSPKVPFAHRILRAATVGPYESQGFSQDVWYGGQENVEMSLGFY